MVTGSYSDAEDPAGGSTSFGGAMLAVAAETTLPRGWYTRGYLSSTQGVDGAYPRAGIALGGHWRYGELAGGIAMETLDDSSLTLPTLHARLGAATGPQLELGILDERSPLHAVVGASTGWKMRSGFALHAGVGLMEDVTATWAEVRIPLQGGGTMGLYGASGGNGSDFPARWQSFGARYEMSFGKH